MVFTPRPVWPLRGIAIIAVRRRGGGEMVWVNWRKTTGRIGMKFCMRLCHHKRQLTKQDGTHPSNGCHGNDKKHCFLEEGG